MPSQSAEPPGRALVTGAAGFIGCHLVDALDARGWSVVGIDNERSGDWSRVSSSCERVVRDLADLGTDDLADLCAGADVVFHLAAEKYNSPGSSAQRIIDVNIAATQRLCEAAGRSRAGKVVFTSSLYAYGSIGPDAMRESDVPRPTTMYGVSKVAGEGLPARCGAGPRPGVDRRSPLLRLRPAAARGGRIQVRDRLELRAPATG